AARAGGCCGRTLRASARLRGRWRGGGGGSAYWRFSLAWTVPPCSLLWPRAAPRWTPAATRPSGRGRWNCGVRLRRRLRGPEGAERRRRRLRPGHGVAAGAGAARAAPGKPPGAARRRRLQRCRGRLPAGRPLGGRALVPRARSRRPAPPRRRRLRGRAWRAAGVPWRLVAALLEEMRAAQVRPSSEGASYTGTTIGSCAVSTC
ncbi:unnamed protein product, partial [Prorocentrum cordatum]